MGTRQRVGFTGPSSSTATTTTTTTTTAPETEASFVLNLQRPDAERSSVTWTPETVDNEKLNRKKSKKCCIFQKTREFGESSTESDSSSESDSGPFAAKQVKKKSDGIRKRSTPCNHGNKYEPDGGLPALV
eukprot:CFRG1257T1